ncbi:hypothetical protein BGX33_002622 [Mortierella sp. NVP41]|nr:hypothetical protein BGX33_002622 [Mortierella sp. NVP41]
MSTTIRRYRQRVKQEWPRLVVALVSLYGIYYAANTIRTTADQFKTLGTLNNLKGETLGSPSSGPIVFGTPQITFRDYGHEIAPPGPPHHSNNYNTNDSYNERSGSTLVPPKSKSLLGKIRILQSATNLEVDFEGQTEAAAIYTLLVISSLSIVDNLIGIMVATRRSLRLTQVALAIWCLRFLFRMLSLISVGFMLAVSTEFRRSHLPPEATVPLPQQQPNSTDADMNGGGGGGGLDFGGVGELGRGEPTMYTITVLEIIVAIVHGWSLLVLIRDLRNQPRPRTVVVRIWMWFCGTRVGRRLGLARFSHHNNNPYLGVGGVGYRGGEGYTGIGGSDGGVGVWDREIAASLGMGSGLLSSGSSVRSIAVSVPEMIIVPGRSRASSISSFSSAEKL